VGCELRDLADLAEDERGRAEHQEPDRHRDDDHLGHRAGEPAAPHGGRVDAE
jgi:hypothetical protein